MQCLQPIAAVTAAIFKTAIFSNFALIASRVTQTVSTQQQQHATQTLLKKYIPLDSSNSVQRCRTNCD